MWKSEISLWLFSSRWTCLICNQILHSALANRQTCGFHILTGFVHTAQIKPSKTSWHTLPNGSSVCRTARFFPLRIPPLSLHICMPKSYSWKSYRLLALEHPLVTFIIWQLQHNLHHFPKAKHLFISSNTLTSGHDHVKKYQMLYHLNTDKVKNNLVLTHGYDQHAPSVNQAFTGSPWQIPSKCILNRQYVFYSNWINLSNHLRPYLSCVCMWSKTR